VLEKRFQVSISSAAKGIGQPFDLFGILAADGNYSNAIDLMRGPRVRMAYIAAAQNTYVKCHRVFPAQPTTTFCFASSKVARLPVRSAAIVMHSATEWL
jgi:hypothetical protein